MLWDYARLARGRNNEDAIKALSELLAQEPARLDARLELAGVQLVSQRPAQALETLKPVTKITPDQAPRLFALLAHAQLDLGLWSEARANADGLAKVARTDEEKLEAQRMLRFLDEREKKLTEPEAPTPPPQPAAPARPAKVRPLSLKKSASGTFVELDCSGKSPKMILATTDGRKGFLIDDPNRVIGETIELTCGAQPKKLAVKVDYLPPDRAGIDGLLRGIQFAPKP